MEQLPIDEGYEVVASKRFIVAQVAFRHRVAHSITITRGDNRLVVTSSSSALVLRSVSKLRYFKKNEEVCLGTRAQCHAIFSSKDVLDVVEGGVIHAAGLSLSFL